MSDPSSVPAPDVRYELSDWSSGSPRSTAKVMVAGEIRATLIVTEPTWTWAVEIPGAPKASGVAERQEDARRLAEQSAQRFLDEQDGVSADALWQRWDAWFEKSYDEIIRANAYRTLFLGYAKLRQAVPIANAGTIFDEFIKDLYVAYMAMLIRRQVDESRDVQSFGRILREMRFHSHRISCEWYFAKWAPRGEDPFDDVLRKNVHEIFDSFAGPEGDHLDAESIALDLAKLKDAAEKVIEFASTVIAHGVENAQSFEHLKIADFHACIDQYSELLVRYFTLVRFATLASAEPSILDNWRLLFSAHLRLTRQRKRAFARYRQAELKVRAAQQALDACLGGQDSKRAELQMKLTHAEKARKRALETLEAARRLDLGG